MYKKKDNSQSICRLSSRCWDDSNLQLVSDEVYFTWDFLMS